MDPDLTPVEFNTAMLNDHDPSCDRPSVECELDHVIEWARRSDQYGQPPAALPSAHKAKHARAERPDLDWEDGVAC